MKFIQKLVPGECRKRGGGGGGGGDEEDDDDDLFIPLFKCSRCRGHFDTLRQRERHVRRVHLRKKRRGLGRTMKISGDGAGDDGDGGSGEDADDELNNSYSGGSGGGGDKPKVSQDIAGGPVPPPKSAVVVLKRLHFFEVNVTTPSPGYRTISYTGTSPSSYHGCGQPQSLTALSKSRRLSYEHYRICTIPALIPRPTAPPPPTMSSLLTPPPSPPSSSTATSKSLHLPIPLLSPSIFSLHGYQDDIHSILSIITSSTMTTPVLDAYLSHLLSIYSTSINQGTHLTSYTLRPKPFASSVTFRLLSVHFVPFRSPMPWQPYHCYSHLRPKFPLDEDTILFCPLYCSGHFYLAVLNFYTSSCHIFDSSWHYFSLELRVSQCSSVINNLGRGLSAKNWKFYGEDKCCQQIDEYSCGIYVIYFVENFLKGRGLRNQRALRREDLEEMRRDVVEVLLRSTEKGRCLLEAMSI